MEDLIRWVSDPDLDLLEAVVAAAMPADEPGGGHLPWSRHQLDAALAGEGARVRVGGPQPAAAVDREPPPPAGFVLARRMLDTLEIDLVGVRPEWRRRGVALGLVRGLIDDERSQGALGEIRLELAAGNRAAAALYARLGFVVVGRRSRYYPDGQDALLLSLRLRPRESTAGARTR